MSRAARAPRAFSRSRSRPPLSEHQAPRRARDPQRLAASAGGQPARRGCPPRSAAGRLAHPGRATTVTEYPPAAGRGRGKDLTRGSDPRRLEGRRGLVPSHENRSHASVLEIKLRRFCDGTKFQFVFFDHVRGVCVTSQRTRTKAAVHSSAWSVERHRLAVSRRAALGSRGVVPRRGTARPHRPAARRTAAGRGTDRGGSRMPAVPARPRRPRSPARRDQALSARRAVGRSARMTGAPRTATAPGSRRPMHRRRSAAHEQPQRAIIAALLGAHAERAGMHRAEHRSARAIDHGDDRLRAARRIEHDPVQLAPLVCHPHELTRTYRLHRRKRTRGEWPRTSS